MQGTVLLVDSYTPYRQELAQRLRDAGFRVMEAHNGVEGLRAVRSRTPDLVVVDLWPFFSASLQMVERLRAGASTASIPVLVVTSPVAAEYRSRGARAGSAGYLEKPCPAQRVVDEVRAILSGGAGAAPPFPHPVAVAHPA